MKNTSTNFGMEEQLRWEDEKFRVFVVFILITIAVIAVLGWLKLPYGFSFIDEGMYLTDAWRLSAGDSYYPNSDRFFGSSYNLVTHFLFYFSPELGILDIRKIQYGTCVIAVALLAGTLFKTQEGAAKFSGVPLSIYLFTGMDVTGMGTSLNYYTVPGLSLLFSLSLAVWAREVKSSSLSMLFLFFTSIALSAASVSYYTVALIFLPFTLFLRKQIFRDPPSFFAYIVPVVLVCAYFLAHANFFYEALTLQFTNSETPSILSVNAYTPFYLAFGMISGFLLLLLSQTRFHDNSLFIFSLFTIFLVSAFSIQSRFFGFLPKFYNGWFNAPGYFAVTAFGLGFAFFLRKAFALATQRSKVPISASFFFLQVSILYALSFSLTSSLGILLLCNVGPIIISAAFLEASSDRDPAAFRMILPVLVFFVPVYWHVMKADWNFTYFDRPAAFLTSEIPDGPAKGLITNESSAEIERVVRQTINKYTNDGDFIISFDQVAVPYFLSKRRPALDHSWTGITHSNYRSLQHSLDEMRILSREPTLAIHFRNKFLYFPSEDFSTFTMSGSMDSTQPIILDYVYKNMRFLGSIDAVDHRLIEFYQKD